MVNLEIQVSFGFAEGSGAAGLREWGSILFGLNTAQALLSKV